MLLQCKARLNVKGSTPSPSNVIIALIFPVVWTSLLTYGYGFSGFRVFSNLFFALKTFTAQASQYPLIIPGSLETLCTGEENQADLEPVNDFTSTQLRHACTFVASQIKKAAI